ncbi:MAG: tripartite tricarboxylate transporter TctB family protein [Caldilineaceae bacterium]|nr:tripartite tricarboxylate transporter TctB family protein [Caldilineaceae bacterium]MCB9159220.1 tripartite tricarboxylate transporter TctB family protein [Caldilineaceae bacterium]
MTHHRIDRIAGVILLLLTAWYTYAATQLKIGFLADPVGPKALPFLLAGLMAVVCIYLIARPEEDPEWPAPAAWLRIGMTVAVFVLYAYTMIPLGYIIATTLMVGLLSLIFQGPRLGSFAAAFVFSLAMYGLFAVLLDLSLPFGRLWRTWLGG